jgi:hypothetical protein
MTIETLLTITTLIITLGTIGFKLAQIVSRIELQVAEIKGIMIAQTHRIDDHEKRIKTLEKDTK